MCLNAFPAIHYLRRELGEIPFTVDVSASQIPLWPSSARGQRNSKQKQLVPDHELQEGDRSKNIVVVTQFHSSREREKRQ